jgi:hypothetical protein
MSNSTRLALRYAQALGEIGKLVGGDPKRPDWDPLDAVELVRELLGADESALGQVDEPITAPGP